MNGDDYSERDASHPAVAILLTAMAGGLGWGIRGQYGHETGAMIAGVLVALALLLTLLRPGNPLSAARIVAFTAIGISMGGMMTYGQTVGLTHDVPLVGNTDALTWGLFGLAIKGGVWIGLAAVFLGMAMGGPRYRTGDWVAVSVLMLFAFFAGHYFLNQPFAPQAGKLPAWYFSDHWKWEPGVELAPRPEKWGGLAAALLAVILYALLVRGDGLVLRLGLWGMLAGAIGFSGGQSVQAMHAWHPEWFQAEIFRHFNWWNMMETTFGFVFGGILAFGVWRNLGHWHDPEPTEAEIPMNGEILLGMVHASALVVWSFLSVRSFDAVADLAIPMILLPVVLAAGGRLGPALVAFPLVTLPIAGKTLRELHYRAEPAVRIGREVGWLVYIILPSLVAVLLAFFWARQKRSVRGTGILPEVRTGMIVITWLFFALNWEFFRRPWPWQDWTGRTPNGVIFLVFSVCLTLAALFVRDRRLSWQD